MTSPSSNASDRSGLRLAFAQSSWHESIVERCRTSFIEEIAAFGIDEQQIDVFRVPGAFELPLLVKRAARSGRYDAVVAAGLVVDGGIYRHEFVASTVLDALMQAQMETDVPVISAVLTPHHFHEHQDHLAFFHEHFVVKGAEAARACIGALAALDELAAASTA
jgi:6,7-dimethyl-8-ribityllumazine synthase